MRSPSWRQSLGIVLLWLAPAATARAQSAAPEPVVQRADTGPCRHFAFSHDGHLLATDNQDEVLLWEVSTGRLLNSMKPYLSPIIRHHLDTGGTEVGGTRAKGTLLFSPDDKFVGVLPVDFAEILNFGPPGAPSSMANFFWPARKPGSCETVSVDRLSGNRRAQGRLAEFLKENAAPAAKILSADRP